MKKPRAPHGQGPAALMMKERARKAGVLANLLWDHLDTDSCMETGRLIPRGGLKRRSHRAMFAFIIERGFCGGRFVTRKVCVKAIKLILSWLEFRPPIDPQQSIADYIHKEAQILQAQCRRAKQLRSNGRRSMDKMETQSLDQQVASCPVFSLAVLHLFERFD